MRKSLFMLSVLVVAVVGCLPNEVTEVSDYKDPHRKPEADLADDRLDDKRPEFDPEVVDRRPLDEFQINASAAVLRLDVPAIKPDTEAALLQLHPTFAAAVKAAPSSAEVLPSVNLLDNKAKQFDDGLVAALDLAYYRGLEGKLQSQVDLIRRLYDAVGKDSPAAPFLAAGLRLASVNVVPADEAAMNAYLREFEKNEVRSRPAGVYTWSKELTAAFRFVRFFQHEFAATDTIPVVLSEALGHDATLSAAYEKEVAFYAHLCNPSPPRCGSLLPSQKKNVAVFPAAGSKETALFERLFQWGLPEDGSLMLALIQGIRAGKIDLKPRPDSGWYDHQVYALETMLLPERGPERDKLLLTQAYKQRMMEAFTALITKRRETHVRNLGQGMAGAAPGFHTPTPAEVRPRLRLEPCPSYYLRTARAYSFIGTFLEAVLGKDGLQALHGLRQGGQREPDLYAELHSMRDLFYGFYLVSAEDIGLKPEFAKDENVDAERCYTLATDYLPKAFADRDLEADTRVIVTVGEDQQRHVTLVWATVGVRLAKLDAKYARPPQVKTKTSTDWRPVEADRLAESHYLIAVDEFVGTELPGGRVLTREEFRTLCDRGQTREGITALLRGKK